VLRARLTTAAVAIPLLLVLIYWAPPWALASVVAVLALLGVSEYAALAFATQPGDRILTLILGAAVIGAAMLGPGKPLVAALSVSVILAWGFVVLFRADFERGLSDVGAIFIGVLYIGLLLPHFVWLHRLPEGSDWVTYVIAVGMVGDTTGYFVGRWLGRHRLAPRLSPGKTIEGAVGILIGSTMTGVAAKLSILNQRSWQEMLLLSLALGVVGQVGDLSESVMKRTFGAKESGWVFPGHGGVLDRIDSLLFPVVLVYYHLL
jgi:phosphatidate cytidylyltransferase